MKIIHLFPHTQNVGDYFVRIGIRKLLSEVIAEIEFTDLPASSKVTRSSDPNALGGITPETVDLLNRHDLIVIGGSNLYETINTNQLEIVPEALEQIKRPILLLGIGAGWSSMSPQFPSISEEVGRKLTLLHEKSCGSSVRDYFTQRLIRTYGIGDPVVTGCPAAYIFEQDLKPVSKGMVYITGLPYRMYTERTLNPMTARWRQSYRRRRQVTVGYARLLKLLTREGLDYRIFITDARDVPIAKKIEGHTRRVVFSESPEELLSQLDACDLLIGYRLHACIPALSKGIPIIPLPLDGRVLGFIETYGLTEYSVNPYDPGQESQVLERTKLALGRHRFAWNMAVNNRDQMAQVMRGFLDKHLLKVQETPDVMIDPV